MKYRLLDHRRRARGHGARRAPAARGDQAHARAARDQPHPRHQRRRAAIDPEPARRRAPAGHRRPAARARLRARRHADLHRRHARAAHLPLRRPVLGRAHRDDREDRLLPGQLQRAVRPRDGRHRRRGPARADGRRQVPRPGAGRPHRRARAARGPDPAHQGLDVRRRRPAQLHRRLARPGARGRRRRRHAGARLLRLPVPGRRPSRRRGSSFRLALLRLRRRARAAGATTPSPQRAGARRQHRAAHRLPARCRRATRTTSTRRPGSPACSRSATTTSTSRSGPSTSSSTSTAHRPPRVLAPAPHGRAPSTSAPTSSRRATTCRLRFPPPPRPGEPPNQPFSTRAVQRERRSSGSALYPAAYVELEIAPDARARASCPGLRARLRQPQRAVRRSARASTAATTSSTGFPRTTAKAGVGLFHQPPQFRRWSTPLGNPELESNRAIHYALGARAGDHPPDRGLGRGFYKQLDRLVVGDATAVQRQQRLLPTSAPATSSAARSCSSTSPTSASSAGSPTPCRAARASTARAKRSTWSPSIRRTS